jgi:DNA invertase Pin-like site-specific DNA recombinase
MRRLLTVLLLALLGVTAPAASQQGGGEGPPTELWKEYPLETVPSAPPSGQEQPPSGQDGGASDRPPAREEPREPAAESSPASEPGDDSRVKTFALIAIVLLVILASAGIVRLGMNARRSRVARDRPPARPSGGPRPAPAAAAALPAPGAPAPPARANGVGETVKKTAEPDAPALPAATKAEPAAARAPEDEPEPAKPEPAESEPARPAPTAPEPPKAEPAPTAPEPPETEPAPTAVPRKARPAPAPTNGHSPSGPPAAIPVRGQAGAERAATSPPMRQVAAEDERALGYTTVARPENAESQLRAEARQIQLACKKRRLPLKKLVRDLESHGRADLTRPGLSFALKRLAKGEYTCLVVTSLDRLTRSAANLGTLIYLLEERRTRLVVVDIDLDTGTEEGRLAARALVKVSGLERKKLEEQTRKGLAPARDKRRSSGRPAVADRPTLRRRIAEMRAEGMTLQAIADTLNEEGVPTLRGGAQWRPSSVQSAAGYKRPPRKTGARARKGGNGSDG